MKTKLYIYFILFFTFITECFYGQIPNNNFENWSNVNLLIDWHTNSCPMCVPQIETYIVQKDSINVYNGNYAAKFVYNNSYPSFATIKFPLSSHPSSLSAYIKNQLFGIDTASLEIKLYKNSMVVDSGVWIDTVSILNYTKLTIPISQNSIQVDSAIITIAFGNIKHIQIMNLPNFWMDNLSFEFANGIEENNKNENNLIVFPNPANKIITIVLPVDKEKLIDLKIYNTIGQTVFQQEYDTEIKSFDVSHFTEGIYFIQVKTNIEKQRFYYKKIIINHK